MSDLDVRPINENEIAKYLRCLGTAFHLGADVTEERIEFSRLYMNDLSRRLGAFVDDQVCGTTGSFGADLTVPGGAVVPTACVTQVTVLPTHRRRGILREMMDLQLRDARDRGEIIAMLIAAEWPIYGRFGYGLSVEAAGTIVDAETAQFVDAALRGTIEVVDLATLREVAEAPFDAHRMTCPGSISREPIMWDLWLGVARRADDPPPKSRVRVVHRDATGTIDGYAVYDAGELWVHNRPKVKLDVQELIVTNADAYTDLWRYLCAIDWVTEVHAHRRPIDEDVRHLFVNGRVARQADRSDHMWCRLIDVPAAMTARRYEVPVSLVLDVRDDMFGGGRYRLDGNPASASCTVTDEPADVALGVDVLAAAYLGSPMAPYVTAGRLTEFTPGSVAALDQSMRTARAPWAPTNF